eukprot:5767838-Amphidinium_carterae.1
MPTLPVLASTILSSACAMTSSAKHRAHGTAMSYINPLGATSMFYKRTETRTSQGDRLKWDCQATRKILLALVATETKDGRHVKLEAGVQLACALTTKQFNLSLKNKPKAKHGCTT